MFVNGLFVITGIKILHNDFTVLNENLFRQRLQLQDWTNFIQIVKLSEHNSLYKWKF